MSQPTLNSPPFSLPPGATFNGGAVPTADASLYATPSDATNLLTAYLAAQAKAELAGTISLADGISDGDYPQFTPGSDGSSIFLIKGNLTDADGNAYLLKDVAGDLQKRSLEPDQERGDSNFVEEGHGADTPDVDVPGVLVISLVGGVAQAHWVKA
jgi:hypothetical protein